MDYIRGVIFLILLLFTSSCSKTDRKEPFRVIDVVGSVGSEKIINLSEIAEFVEYIPLETTLNSLFLGAGNGGIFYEGNNIFVKNKLELLVFDNKGKFLRKISRAGRGPGEYLSLGVHIPSGGNVIYIHNIGKHLEYDREGNFISERSFRDVGNIQAFTAINKIGENLYAIEPFDCKDNAVLLVDSSLVTVGRVTMPSNFINNSKTLSNGMPGSVAQWRGTFYNYNDSLRITWFYDDYVVSIGNNSTGPDTLYRFEYGPYRLSPGKDDPRRITGDLIRLHSYMNESRRFLFMQFQMGSLAKKPRVMYPVGKYGQDRTFSVNINSAYYDKSTGRFVFMEQPRVGQFGFNEDFHGGPAVWPLYISSDNYMISLVNITELRHHVAENKVSEELRALAATLSDQDNPVVIKVKLK